MALHLTEGFVIIRFADILYCEAMGNYCRIHLRNQQSHLASRPLKTVFAVLPAAEFIRTHKSYVVRFDEIVMAGAEVKLSNGKMIPVSRNQRNNLDALLRNRLPIV